MDSQRSTFRYDAFAFHLTLNDPGDRRSASARSLSPPRLVHRRDDPIAGRRRRFF